jgi:phosphate transport system substrate-binding protein
MRMTKRLGTATIAAVAMSAGIAAGTLAQDLEGSVVVSGSSTVRPITDLVAETFIGENPNVTISVDGPGTTAGFELFCNGEADINDASRAIREEEVGACTTGGVEPLELKIGVDGLAVVVSTQNDTITCLNFNDLYAIFGVESDQLATWEDVATFAAALGSATSTWPTGDLSITAPGDESGTWGSFIEIALGDIQEARVEAGVEAANVLDEEGELLLTTRTPGDIYVASGDDNAIIEGVGGNPNGIGFVGFAYAVNNPDLVRMIEVDGGEGCVAPDHETVASGTYPIARDLFIYPDAGRLDPANENHNPALAPFVDLYMGPAGQEAVIGAGYVELSPEALAETQATWDTAKSDAGA